MLSLPLPHEASQKTNEHKKDYIHKPKNMDSPAIQKNM